MGKHRQKKWLPEKGSSSFSEGLHWWQVSRKKKVCLTRQKRSLSLWLHNISKIGGTWSPGVEKNLGSRKKGNNKRNVYGSLLGNSEKGLA